ncbi:hypothetical protein F2Q69_00033260 [Brassica cretica]|uniref:Uncharacterized protein n=1 Tax=Brassica cretica TaxID=69181 RepID=A0A8S9SCW7_BRACR|nr:hypothetical protein F2Q69_00033260 [Brassica cretica]
MVYKYVQDKGESKENQGGGGVIVTPLVRESDVEDGGSEVDDNVSSSKTKSDGSNEVEAHHELTGSIKYGDITSKLGYRSVSDLTPTEIAIEAFEQVQSFLNKEDRMA